MKRLSAKNVTEIDWPVGVKPFDMASCDWCLTMHRTPDYCRDPAHAPLRAAIRKLYPGPIGISNAWLRENFSKVAALRKKYRRFWGEK